MAMNVDHRAIEEIRPNPGNARTHPAKQIRQIVDSIAAFGFTSPLLVSEDCELIAGHGRYAAAKLLGIKTVPVVVIAGLSRAKRRALAIADNRIAENAGWDRERLSIEIPELSELLRAEGLDFSVLGFTPIEIEELQTQVEPVARSAKRSFRGDDATADQIDPSWGKAPGVTQRGDLWVLGDHALLCGDARSTSDLARLMSGSRAAMAFLDPRDSMTAPNENPVAESETLPGDFLGFLSSAFAAAAAVTRTGGVHFVCAAWPHLAAVMGAATAVYGNPIDGAVWIERGAQPGALYRGQQELIGVFAAGKGQHFDAKTVRGKCVRASVWDYPAVTQPNDTKEPPSHGRAKPIALIADTVKDVTRRGDTVLDTFAGTGTTVMAAERVNRQARALEREPRLVDLSIRRWQAATGGTARHAENGLSFDEIAARGCRCERAISTAKN